MEETVVGGGGAPASGHGDRRSRQWEWRRARMESVRFGDASWTLTKR